MTEEPMETLPPPRTLERIPHLRQSPWPVIVAMGLLVLLLVGAVFLLLRSRSGHEPWRIDYPGVEWVRGEDSNTREGYRYLQAEVRFDQDVLSAADFQPFLAELVKHTKNVYVYYHIRALNKRGQYVLDAVAREDGLFSVKTGPDYEEQ